MSVQSIVSDFTATSLAAVQANTLAAVHLQVSALNEKLTSIYQTAFSNWLISWNAARISDKATAPEPPLGYVVGYFSDPTSGPGSLGPYGDTVVQWAYPAIGSTPVCAKPAIPEQVEPQIHPVVTGNDRVMNVPPADMMPVGSILPAPDGSKWQKMASITPWGTAVYYARIG